VATAVSCTAKISDMRGSLVRGDALALAFSVKPEDDGSSAPGRSRGSDFPSCAWRVDLPASAEHLYCRTAGNGCHGGRLSDAGLPSTMPTHAVADRPQWLTRGIAVVSRQRVVGP
jgi:hypothetical protein